ncbi:MAG: glycosyltransferase family A protein [Caldimonas sp.]
MSDGGAAAPAQAPEFSVLIARASLEDATRILQTLEAMRRQDCDFAFETIVVDRIGDATTSAVEQRFPEVRLSRCAASSTLPMMRTAALRSAGGRYVAITEDHCVPEPGWLRAFAVAFQRHPEAIAVGGPVLNGLDQTVLDWASYLCEYATFARPYEDGPRDDLPGMNIAYLRGALLSASPGQLTRGFWETTLHPDLLRRGRVFFASGAAAVAHCKRFSLRTFVTQRFAYSRYFAGIRFPGGRWAQRTVAALATPLLPAVLLVRLALIVRGKTGLTRPFVISLPCLVLFHVVGAIGECVGYLFGPGTALERIE